MPKPVRIAATTLGLLVALVLALPALGAGPGGYAESNRPDAPLAPVQKALDKGQYEKALELLQPIRKEDPGNADAWNLTGYASRKLGRVDKAKAAYAKALAIDPEHKLAHAYLGELHLQIGDLAAAEKQLAVLEGLCSSGCREERILRKAIDKYRVEHRSAR